MAFDAAKSGGTGITYLPPQIKDEYKQEDYVQALRFIASRYNMPTYLNNQWNVSAKELGLPIGFASRCFVWRNYYQGNQNNITYNQVNLKEDGTRLALKTFRGKDIFKFVNYCLDPIIDISKRIPKIISAETVSEDVVSQRRLTLDNDKFMLDQQQTVKYMNQKYGLYYQTANGVKFTGDLGKQVQAVNFRESLADAGVKIAKDVYYRNIMDEKIVEWGKDSLITGFAGAKVSIVNGYPLVDVIPSHEAIFPPSTIGDQFRKIPYAGRIRFLTVQEVAAMYGKYLTKKELEDIQTTAMNQGSLNSTYTPWTFFNTLSTPIYFDWWSMWDGVPRIAVVEGQWASYRKADADEQRQCLREGVLIGNKYLIQEGITTNITRDWRNPQDTELDYMFVQPMSVFGKNMGIPETLYLYQDRVDFLQTKIDHWINQTKGTFYLINGSYLDEGVDATQIMSSISDMRIEVVKGVDEDAGDITNKFMQQGAIEMPRDIVNVMNELSRYRSMMADILNIPDAVRGMTEGYIPAKTLNFQQSQSGKGTRYYYNPMNTFFNRVLQKAVDKFKLSTLDNPTFEYTLIVGDAQIEQFKATDGFGLSQYAIYLGFEDLADDGYKQRMMDMMFAYAQNPQSGYTLADYNALETMYTKSEIQNYLQYRDFEIKTQQMEAEQQARAAQEAQAAEQMASQEELAMINNEGANERTAMQLDSKEAIEEAKMLNQQ